MKPVGIKGDCYQNINYIEKYKITDTFLFFPIACI